MWIFEKKPTDIHKYIKEDSALINISKIKVGEILHNLRIFIVHYYKRYIVLKKISTQNAFEYFVVESVFIRIKGKILWVIYPK